MDTIEGAVLPQSSGEEGISLTTATVNEKDSRINQEENHDVIELEGDFDFEGYQVVRREFFAHTFEPSLTFNNYKVYVNIACLNKFPNDNFVQVLINRTASFWRFVPAWRKKKMPSPGALSEPVSESQNRSHASCSLPRYLI